MTFAEGVLRLVRGGSRVDSHRGRAASVRAETAAAAPAAGIEPVAASGDLTANATAELPRLEPGLADIEAAVALVECGLATRVVLTNFASWPGLLWQAYQLAEVADVMIVPTIVHPGGRVDVVVTRDPRVDG